MKFNTKILAKKVILTERLMRGMVWSSRSKDHRCGTCCEAEKPFGADFRFFELIFHLMGLILDYLELILDFLKLI